jgi:phospholipase/carboxylesterase
LQAKPSLQKVRFIFPQAPVRPVTLNQGYVMPAWYDIYQMDKHGPQDEAGIEQSSAALIQLVEQQIALGIPAEKIFLVGFSQGGAMVLYTSLMAKRTFAGVVGLSAYLPLIDKVASSAVNYHNSYWLAHGSHDSVVPFIYGEESAAKLRDLGCAVTFNDFPIAHDISIPEVEAMSAWIAQRIE